jgi:hypothetical protein
MHSEIASSPRLRSAPSAVRIAAEQISASTVFEPRRARPDGLMNSRFEAKKRTPLRTWWRRAGDERRPPRDASLARRCSWVKETASV